MTKEELKQHCEKQVKACEMWAENRGQEPSGKVYEEHKLVLDLINELQYKSYELWKESYEVEYARNIQLEEKIKALEQQSCDDCENNDGECCRLLFEKSFNKDCVSRQKCKEGMLKYGFHAPDMTVTEFIEDELPPVTPKIPTSEDYVSLGVYKQVMWERDIAIEQLKELSYSFGEKIRTSNDCVSRADLLAQINESWETIETKLDFVNIVKASPSVTSKVPALDDCVSREDVIRIAEQGQVQGFVWQFRKLVTMPPVTPTHGTCKDCKSFCCPNGIMPTCIKCFRSVTEDFYCADFEKRGSENG